MSPNGPAVEFDPIFALMVGCLREQCLRAVVDGLTRDRMIAHGEYALLSNRWESLGCKRRCGFYQPALG